MNKFLSKETNIKLSKKPRKFLSALFTISFFLIPIFSNAADLYWIGGSGDWSDLSHWATTSGGSTQPSTVPQSVDNVYFDANSGFLTGDQVNYRYSRSLL